MDKATKVGDDGYYNADFDWDSFDSDSYRAHNYLNVRADDRQIMSEVRDFLIKSKSENLLKAGAQAFEVGPGANLYPSLAMLPFCESIDLHEWSATNVGWLKEQVNGAGGFDRHWDDFWDVYSSYEPYRSVENPRTAMDKIVSVIQGSIFSLPKARYDLGAMFFVAESLTRDLTEFKIAIHRFRAALRPGAPFVIAFMVNSTGYDVAGQMYPAVAIDGDQVRGCLDKLVPEVKVIDISDDGAPLRDGCGMVLATGFVAG